MLLTNDGSAAISRVMEAYGFKFKNDLCRHVGMSSSTLATWVSRNHFPAELVIRCSIDTGVSLQWLTTGTGRIRELQRTDIESLSSCVLSDGKLLESGSIMFDKLFLPAGLRKPFVLRSSGDFYFLEKDFADTTDGQWLVEIEGKSSIRELAFVPIKKVKVLGGGVPFDCSVDEISIVARVVSVQKKV